MFGFFQGNDLAGPNHHDEKHLVYTDIGTLEARSGDDVEIEVYTYLYARVEKKEHRECRCKLSITKLASYQNQRFLERLSNARPMILSELENNLAPEIAAVRGKTIEEHNNV